MSTVLDVLLKICIYMVTLSLVAVESAASWRMKLVMVAPFCRLFM